MHTSNYTHLLKNCTIFNSPCSLHVNSISCSHLICYRGVWQLACVQTCPLPQEKSGDRGDVCESPTIIVFKYKFA